MNERKNIAAFLLGAIIVGCAPTFLASTSNVLKHDFEIEDTYVQETPVAQSQFVQTAARIPSAETDFTVAAESTINSVVSIKSYAAPKRQQQSFGGFNDPFEFFFGPEFGRRQQQREQKEEKKEEKMQPMGLGSGVIITEDGYIVTNNHVVDGAEKLDVTLNDNRKFNAKVVGTDPNSDLALLKIEANGLQPIVFGDSDGLKVGEWVLAVGNPFGFTSTVTAGIVSAKARALNVGGGSKNLGIESFIQTDAAINPGNSGGALVNTKGELIGINTQIYSQTGSYAGYSFAIPSIVVKKVVEDIRQYGTVQRAVLGIQFTELDADRAEEHKITAVSEGVYVAAVVDRSAAKEAGLQEGDVIVKINNDDVKNSGQMKEAIAKLRPGDKVVITYYRDNKKATATATLKNSQGNTKISKSADVSELGVVVKPLSAEKKKELQISNGVEVVTVNGGKFKESGIKAGMIITSINGRTITSADDLESMFDSVSRSNEADKVMVIYGIYPTGKKWYKVVDLSDDEEPSKPSTDE